MAATGTNLTFPMPLCIFAFGTVCDHKTLAPSIGLSSGRASQLEEDRKMMKQKRLTVRATVHYITQLVHYWGTYYM